MADTKISALASASTPLAGTEVLPIVQSGTTKKVAVSDLTAGRAVAASSFKVGGSGTGAIYSPTSINCGLGIFSIGAGSNSANGRGPGAGYSADSDGNVNVYRGFWWQLGAADQAHLMLGNSTASAFNNPLSITTDTNVSINTGNLSFGTSGKGIYFGASSQLNDYEEGTFTATLTGGTTAPSTPITRTGYYTKVGNMVSVYISFSNVDTTGASGQIQVTGLPYTSTSATTSSGTIWINQSSASGIMTIDTSATTLGMLSFTGSSVTWSGAGAGCYARMQITYKSA